MTTDAADGLIGYLRASPSPFHAVATSARMLTAAGFAPVPESSPMPAAAGRYFLVRGGSLVAWSTEHAAGPATGFRVVGAHTDSPNLRVKPRPDLARAGFRQLGVEVYGGPLLNSWLDRDLGLSGRIAIRAAATDRLLGGDTGSGATAFAHDVGRTVMPATPAADPSEVATVLVHFDEPLLRIPQLAIHLDRSVNSDGVKLNPQQHLSPIWGLGADPGDFTAFLAERIGVARGDVLGWDMMTHDVQPPQRIGAAGEFVAGGRMDNLATSFAGTSALIAACDRSAGPGGSESADATSSPIPVLVLFDHEEVGSTSERGANSTLLPAVLERIVLSRGGSRDELHRALAATVVASGDMAHATHPNYSDRHEPQHQISLDGGPVLKVNSQLRYATGAPGAAAFALACEQAGVPLQRFVNRTDLPCGSTVGPMTAALTGAETVDVGAPMLSMHSAREVVGAADQAMYAAALAAFLAPAG